MSQPSPLLLYAFTKLSHMSKVQSGTIKATIYMGKGQHFMFSCSAIDASSFSNMTGNLGYLDYCSLLYSAFPFESGQFKLDRTDNYDITL